MNVNTLPVGMAGLGMIFEETYRPCFERLHQFGLFRREFGLVNVALSGVASRTGTRGAAYQQSLAGKIPAFANFAGPGAIDELLRTDVKAVCIATPDDRHFEVARKALMAGKHILIEKPSVLTVHELDELTALSRVQKVLAKVVYHKLADPDHKKLRTHVLDGNLQHVNNGYCSLLEPKSIATGQFAEWITGRNPGTYVAVHYLKLIDFTFGPNWKLSRIACTGQRGIVSAPRSKTWDSVQLQVTYEYPDQREATFDIHTSWVNPDNFTGYVDQEVQFRFDNGVWLAHQRRRGVEMVVENRTPRELKNTPNHHYNGTFQEPWEEKSQRGYGIEIIERFFEEVSYIEFADSVENRNQRFDKICSLSYNDIIDDRNTVSIVQAMEYLLNRLADGHPGGYVGVNVPEGGLVYFSRTGRPEIIYSGKV